LISFLLASKHRGKEEEKKRKKEKKKRGMELTKERGLHQSRFTFYPPPSLCYADDKGEG